LTAKNNNKNNNIVYGIAIVVSPNNSYIQN